MRKISKPLALMGILAPLSVSALGVGEIELHSALNQNLVAEIPLLTTTSEQPSDIRVRLASPYAFSKAGIDRHYFLTGLRFSTETKSDGQVVINVSSRDAVREPFLNFLIEVNWPQGQMLREFTLLLDPPSTFADKKVVETRLPQTGDTRTESAMRAGVQKTQPVVDSPKSDIRRVDSLAYGPVTNNDTLWDIAKKLNSDAHVTHEQMMMGLFHENPDAFIDGNVNQLKAGQVLNKPTAQVLDRYTPIEARREFYRQYQVWKQGSKNQDQHLSGSSETDEQGNSETYETEKPLTLLAPGDSRTSMPDAEGSGRFENNPQFAPEVVETLRQENSDLRERLDELEQQLVATQKLIDLQNQQLALIQQERLLKTQEESIVVSEQEAASAPVALKGSFVEGNSISNPTVSEQTDVSKADKPQLEQHEATQAVKPTSEEIRQRKIAEGLAAKNDELSKQSSEDVAEKSSYSWIADYLLSPYVAAAGAGILFLILAAAIVIRRKKQAASDTLEPISFEQGGLDSDIALTGANQITGDDFLAGAISSENGYDTGIIAESSFLSEFTPGNFDSDENESDEIDPVAEADVYLAYGRYTQAEELIKTALESTPHRLECKHKLLEIYFAAEQAEKFAKYAEKLSGEGLSNNTEFWTRVEEMGKVICPTHLLFGGSMNRSDIEDEHQIDTSVVSGPEEFVREDNSVPDFDFSSFNIADSGLAVDDVHESHASKQALEFDVGANHEVNESIDAGIEGIGFDSEISSSEENNELNNGDELGTDILAGNEMEFEPNLPIEKQDEPLSVDEEQTLAGNEIEFSVEGVEKSIDESATVVDDSGIAIASELEELLRQHEGSHRDESDDLLPDSEIELIGEDNDITIQDASVVEEEHEVQDDSESTMLLEQEFDIDEIETKLDLAKAYVDMNDAEAAGEMLKEVEAAGTSEQVEEAAQLLKQLERSQSKAS